MTLSEACQAMMDLRLGLTLLQMCEVRPGKPLCQASSSEQHTEHDESGLPVPPAELVERLPLPLACQKKQQ